MTPEDMKNRLRQFALRCLKLAKCLPRSAAGEVIGRQLIRSATGAAANYRAACIARSRADFASKLGIVEEELDESVFWVDFSVDAELVKPRLVAALLREGEELRKIIIASRKTAKRPPAVNRGNSQS